MCANTWWSCVISTPTSWTRLSTCRCCCFAGAADSQLSSLIDAQGSYDCLLTGRTAWQTAWHTTSVEVFCLARARASHIPRCQWNKPRRQKPKSRAGWFGAGKAFQPQVAWQHDKRPVTTTHSTWWIHFKNQNTHTYIYMVARSASCHQELPKHCSRLDSMQQGACDKEFIFLVHQAVQVNPEFTTWQMSDEVLSSDLKPRTSITLAFDCTWFFLTWRPISLSWYWTCGADSAGGTTYRNTVQLAQSSGCLGKLDGAESFVSTRTSTDCPGASSLHGSGVKNLLKGTQRHNLLKESIGTK